MKETRAMQFVGLPSERAETAVDEALRPASHRRRCDTDDDNLASGGGGRRSALAARPATQSLVTRLRRSVWAPVALRAAGIAAGLLGLAAVGAASTLNGEGIEVAATSSASPARPPSESAAEAAMGAAWLSAGPEQAAKGKSAPSEPSHDSKPRKSAEPVPQGKSPGVTEDGRVILNTANAEELTKLPSVGKKRAEAILELRQRLKRFRRPTDLLRVRGIGVKTLKKMLPHLVVDPPAR